MAGIAVLSLLSFLGSLPSLTPQWAQVRPVCHAGVTEVTRRRRHGHRDGHGLPLRSVRRGPGRPWRGAAQWPRPRWPSLPLAVAECAFPPQPPARGERAAGRAGPGRPPAECHCRCLRRRPRPQRARALGPWHASVLLVPAGLAPGRAGCSELTTVVVAIRLMVPQSLWWWWLSRCSVNGGTVLAPAPWLAVTVALSGPVTARAHAGSRRCFSPAESRMQIEARPC